MKKIVYRNRYLSIERETYRIRGRTAEVFREIKPDIVIVVPRLPDCRFLMERQYRHAIKKYLYEFPAGQVDLGETPKTAAARELEEETGYRARRLTPLSEFYWIPGSSYQKHIFFYADVADKGKRHLDDTEEISIVKMDGTSFEKAMRSGKIRDGKTALGFLLYSKYLAGKQS
jgi:ADP-ribose pyrophosphatase